MNKLTTDERVRVVSCLVEGNSLRSTVRMTGIHRTTIQKLLVELGNAGQEYQHKTLTGLSLERVQCDEIWSFCGAKQKNVPKEKQDLYGIGSVWTWTAIDPDSKLVFSWLCGLRTVPYAKTFMAEVASQLNNRVQPTTDGLRSNLQATWDAFETDVDYCMFEKHYGMDPNKGESRYSPAKLPSINVVPISGNPDSAHASTSHVERQNLTMRMSMRRFTRLTNAFSQKIENHEAAIALHFMYYNFARVHQTLRITPAMKAGVSDHIWSLAEIVGLLD